MGFRVESSGFRVQGFGFMVWSSWFRGHRIKHDAREIVSVELAGLV